MRTDAEPLAQLLAELSRLREVLPEVSGSLVASADGLLIADGGQARSPASAAEGVAALSAASLGLSQRIADVVGHGVFSELLVRSNGGYVAMYLAGDSAVLVLIADDRVNVARMNLEARRAVGRIASIVEVATETSFAQAIPVSSLPRRGTRY
jgi:uncharacterized protein